MPTSLLKISEAPSQKKVLEAVNKQSSGVREVSQEIIVVFWVEDRSRNDRVVMEEWRRWIQTNSRLIIANRKIRNADTMRAESATRTPCARWPVQG